MVRLTVVIFSFLVLTELWAAPVRGHWKCVALGPSTLALTGDYTKVQEQLFRKHFAERQKSFLSNFPHWAAEQSFNLSGTLAIADYRPEVVSLLRDQPRIKLNSQSPVPISVTGTGYWLSPVGQVRFPDEKGNMRLSCNADVAHYLFLMLSRPLAEGEKITITLPAGEKLDFTWRQNDPSPIFKINQVGHLPKGRKYAYIGAWLGNAGPLKLHQSMNGKTFHLVDLSSGKNVFSGKLNARQADSVNVRGEPFTGEEVLELDFSAFETPGQYALVIPGFGSSYPFRINDDTMAEAFFIHARGLFHQRCGIAKGPPHTHWIQKTCHPTCYQGSFPPSDLHYGKANGKRAYGFFDILKKSVKVNRFELIRHNVPSVPKEYHAPGGWHDAADWDRRPQHMGIVGDLVTVYLLKPGNFCDGQLNIPESGNGIPDILDEARWGLEHLRLTQHRNGGVGTWIETTRHPRPGEGMASDDRLKYYVSCATRNSTLEYAAYASQLALALRHAHAEKFMKEYLDSARKAWDYAVNPLNRKVRFYRVGKNSLHYLEEPELAPEYVVKAGYNLFLLTNDSHYLRKVEETVPAALKSLKRNAWRWSPFLWMELEHFPNDSAAIEKLKSARRKTVVDAANNMLRQQDVNYPIRIAWFGPRDAWVHTMSWGTYHPLFRARTFIAAHAMTHDRNFLDGALLANDFNNGANPSGSSMTSGLGRVYPVRFLDLNSYADGIDEPVPGLTPYRNTYGIPRPAVKMAYGLFYPKRMRQNFPGLKLSLLPRPGLNENECAKAVSKLLPIWHRWVNVEAETAAASEYTVWETISPAAAVTGYLLNGASKPDPRWINRRPSGNVRELPGYDPLP